MRLGLPGLGLGEMRWGSKSASVTYGSSVSIDLGSGAAVSAAATIGPIDGGRANWQQRSGFPTFTASNLQDQSGAATTLDANLSSTAGNFTTRATDDGGAEFDMFTRGVLVTSTDNVITLSQIPYASYDVIVCIDEYTTSPSGQGVSISDGTTNYYTQSQQVARWSNEWVRITSENSGSPDLTGNYCAFESLSAASVTITLSNTIGSGAGICLSGIQVIERT